MLRFRSQAYGSKKENTTILYLTRWDTSSTNHQYIHNQDVWVQKEMYDSIFMFFACVLPPPSPTKQCWYIHVPFIHL